MISIFWIGLVAAFLHVISGPDHLAAVTPLVTDAKKQHWKVGFFWGIGHVIGMLSIGVLFLFLKDQFLLEKISQYSELLVGFVLIFIGLWMLFRLFIREIKHNHPHFHLSKSFMVHTHAHSHSEETHTHQHQHSKSKHQHPKSSLYIGILHGFAGIGHFILFFPVLGFSEISDRAYYIVGFGIGSIVAMTLYALIIGKLRNVLTFSKTLSIGLRVAASIFAIGIGFYWIFLSF